MNIMMLAVSLLLQIGASPDAMDPSYIVGHDVYSSCITVGTSPDADFADLQSAIDFAGDFDVIFIENGRYAANPSDYLDPLCGNCLEHETEVTATTGYVITGKSLTVIGEGHESVELVTNAGYGIFIDDCKVVVISGVTVTGGVRDQDGNATDAAIVVRDSFVNVKDCEIRDNEGNFETTIAGIGGIMGREGATLYIEDNYIHDNSWDGVALYRGAHATIISNEIWNGRGAGIGITWDSTANISNNDIHDYWKGIGSFGETDVTVFNNFVHDLRGWGIVATGESTMNCYHNTVVRCGNVGIAGWNGDATIDISKNIIAFNGTVDQWVAPRVGIWMNCNEPNYTIENNCIFGNHDAGVAFGYSEFDDGTWGFTEEHDYDGINGNFYSDPMLIDDGYQLHDDSPCTVAMAGFHIGASDDLLFDGEVRF